MLKPSAGRGERGPLGDDTRLPTTEGCHHGLRLSSEGAAHGTDVEMGGAGSRPTMLGRDAGESRGEDTISPTTEGCHHGRLSTAERTDGGAAEAAKIGSAWKAERGARGGWEARAVVDATRGRVPSEAPRPSLLREGTRARAPIALAPARTSARARFHRRWPSSETLLAQATLSGDADHCLVIEDGRTSCSQRSPALSKEEKNATEC